MKKDEKVLSNLVNNNYNDLVNNLDFYIFDEDFDIEELITTKYKERKKKCRVTI